MRRALLALALLPMAAGAQEIGAVYDPLPPPGSAYVRFVNATGEPVSVQPDFAQPVTLGTDGAARVTPYGVAEGVQGRALGVRVSAGGAAAQAVLHVEPGGFLTVIVEPGSSGPAVVPVVDKTEFNQARARLAFYNAAPGCEAAKLVLATGNAAVFQDVAPGTAAARSVNPVSAPIKLLCGGQEAAALTLSGMEAGGMYSVWLMHPASGAVAFLARDATVRLKR